MRRLHLYKMTFADGYKTTVTAQSLFDAMWEVDADTKTHGIVTHVSY